MRFSSFTYLVGQGLHNLKANKMMTLASMGVLIVCMILVGAAFLFGANIDSMVAYIGEQNETVAFINDDADTAAVEEAIRSIPHVAGVEFISKDQMLDEYSQRLEGYTNLKEMFQNDNPLLANYVVRADDPANISSVAAALQNVDGVRAVNSPQAMSDLFVSLQKAVTYVLQRQQCAAKHCRQVGGVLAVPFIHGIVSAAHNGGSDQRGDQAGGNTLHKEREPDKAVGCTNQLHNANLLAAVEHGNFDGVADDHHADDGQHDDQAIADISNRLLQRNKQI